jgi:hypothetical protein
MAIAIYGVTLISEEPWTREQRLALHQACREILLTLKPGDPPTEKEVADYWRERMESPYSAVVYGERCPYTVYWQTLDEEEAGLLYAKLEKYCCPLGLRITSHFSI